jgi:DNA-binding HxlR family transcriptional regulator
MGIQNQRSRCAISLLLDIVGDKWSLLILRDAVLFDKRRYREFLASPEGISTNILAARLKQLECHGLLEKFSDIDDGKAFRYVPTERAVTLIPVVVEVVRWGSTEFDEIMVPELMTTLLEGGTGRFIGEKSAALSHERSSIV